MVKKWGNGIGILLIDRKRNFLVIISDVRRIFLWIGNIVGFIYRLLGVGVVEVFFCGIYLFFECYYNYLL